MLDKTIIIFSDLKHYAVVWCFLKDAIATSAQYFRPIYHNIVLPAKRAFSCSNRTEAFGVGSHSIL